MKKILAVVSNETASILMSSFAINSNVKIDIIIEKSFNKKNKVEENIVKIFDKQKLNKILILKKCSSESFFYFKNILNFFSIRKQNLKSLKYIFNQLDKNKIYNYDEIWFSHEHCARFIAYNYSEIKQRYFFHGYGDINLLKKNNFLRRFKIWLENKLNESFFKNTIPINNKKIKYYNFFNKYYSDSAFEKPKAIPLKFYKEILLKYSKKFKIKNKYKNIILISGNLPTFKDEKHIEKFVNEYCELLKKYIPNNHKFTIIIKEKNNTFYSKKFKIKFYRKIKKTIPNKVIIFNKIFKRSIPFEILAIKLKPKIIISQLSTSDFILSKILRGSKYLSTKKFISTFVEENKINSKNDKNFKIIENGLFIQKNLSKPSNIKFI